MTGSVLSEILDATQPEKDEQISAWKTLPTTDH
jgi:hypothetical protein